MEPATLSLTIILPGNASSTLTAAANTPIPTMTDLDNPVSEGGAARSTVQANSETMQSTAVTATLSPLSRTSDLATGSGTPVPPMADSQTEMSGTALRRAEGVIGTMKTWNSAVGLIKRVMDTVGPIAEVCQISYLRIFCWANFRSSAEPIREVSMGSALNDPRGASPCLIGGYGTPTLFFSHLASRLWYDK
jgi:hypothetical protein